MSGSTPKTNIAEFWDGDVKWITPAELDENTYIITDSVRKITNLAMQKTGLTAFPAGTVILSSRAPIGKVAIAGCKMCCNQGFKNFICSELVNNKYLYWFLKHNTAYLNSLGRGATFKEISKSIVSSIEINLPSLEEQQRVVDNIEKISTIITLRKKEISILDDLIKARFVEMFGDPETNSKGWAEISLSEKLNVLGGYAFKSDQFEETGGIPVLRIGNINSGYFKPVNMVYWKEDRSLERYAMYPGDLVMSLTGTVGKDDYGNVCILGNAFEMYYLNQRNAKLELKDGLDKYYLAELLKFSQVKKKLTGISRGVRQANISNKDILNLVTPIPPMELQQQFANFVAQIDKSKLLSGCRLFHSWAPENRDKPQHVGVPRRKTKDLRGGRRQQ